MVGPRKAAPPTRRRARDEDAKDRLRALVYVLEGTISTIIDDVEAWRDGKAKNDPVPQAGQLVCADVARELVAELTQRLVAAKAQAAEQGVELWDEMGLPEERR